MPPPNANPTPGQPNPSTPPAGYTPLIPPNPTAPPPPAPQPTVSAQPGGQVISGGFNPTAASIPGGPPPGQNQAFVGSFDAPGVTTAQPVINTAVSAAPAASRRRFMKPLLISIVALLVIGGGAAFAYVGVIVPNQPANVLRKAVLNSIQAQQASASGTIEDPTGALKVAFDSAADTANKAADLKLNITYTGINFPIEARYVQRNAYVRVGDLGTISSLVNAYSPDAGKVVTGLSQQLSNKWISIDSTLIDQDDTAKCLLNMPWTLNKTDIKQLQTQYDKQQFATIKTASSDKIGSVSAEKFDLSISNASIKKFGDGLKSLSIVKNAEKCPGVSGAASSMQLTANKIDTSTTPLTIWVDKSTKHIIRIASHTSSGSTLINLKYSYVSITAPQGATPVLQFLSTLQGTLSSSGIDLSQLGGSSSSGGNLSDKDAKRTSDLKAIQTQLEAYFSENGNYPSRADMNSAAWLGTNMKGLDQNALQDPEGNSKQFAASPGAHVYAYQPTQDDGSSCESDDTQCTKFTLTATKTDGSTIVLKNLD